MLRQTNCTRLVILSILVAACSDPSTAPILKGGTLREAARSEWDVQQNGLSACMKQEGFDYEPIQTPREAVPAYVLPVISERGIASLRDRGYGLRVRFEIARSFEQQNPNTQIYEAYSASTRGAYNKTIVECMRRIPRPTGVGSSLRRVSDAREDWLQSPELIDEWAHWSTCMGRGGFSVSRRDETFLESVSTALEHEASARGINLEAPDDSTVLFVTKFEKSVAATDGSCLGPILPSLAREWAKFGNPTDLE
jgi:hypothetical protein